MIDEQVINKFKGVSLEEINSLSLMNRTDTKYFFHESELPAILMKVCNNYQVLEINACRQMPYSSLYYDTKDFGFYIAHHNGKLNRYKIRLRDYTISGDSFFEIKKKTNKKRTKKLRIRIPYQTKVITDEAHKFLAEKAEIDGKTLVPSLENNFKRVTLAGFASQERVTIDYDINYSIGDMKSCFEGIIVAEVKRSSDGPASPFMKVLRDSGIFKSGFSKYCLGIASVHQEIKKNNFKQKIYQLNKLINEYSISC